MGTFTPVWISYTPPTKKFVEPASKRFGQVNLFDIAFGVFQQFDKEARSRKVRLILETTADWQMTDVLHESDFDFEGNAAEVNQIIAQMVKNALAQTLEGFIKIRLSALKDELLVEVEDSGLGIAPGEKIATIDAIYKGKSCRITHFQDAETSMETIASQIKSHGAKMQYSIIPGKGMKRRLFLPVQSTLMPALVH